MAVAKIRERGQITIPKQIRDSLGLKKKKGIKMKNQLLVLFMLATGLGFTTVSYSETVVSLQPTTDLTALSVGQQVKVDIKIKEGKGVAGAGPQIVFDSARLKYIGTTPGDYLPAGGVWMIPERNAEGNYQIKLTIGDTTTTGTSVNFPPTPDAPGVSVEAISVDHLLFAVPQNQVPPEFAAPGAQYWTFSFLASSPLGADTNPIGVDGDGTLATLTFEVIAAKPAMIALLEPNLSNSHDELLTANLQNDRITVEASENLGPSPVDVNRDGKVNILDLVFVASHFGETVTDSNIAADVNTDGKINIQDLVRIAQHFGA